MIAQAHAISEETRDGISYAVGDAAQIGCIGQFDTVTAAWLFNYASTVDELQKMFANAALNLKSGGRLVVSLVGAMAPGIVAVMAPLEGVKSGVQTGFKNARFSRLLQAWW
jgi:hypothetical protein